MAVGSEGHGLPDADVVALRSLEQLADRATVEMAAYATENLGEELRVEEAFETDEAVFEWQVIAVGRRRRGRIVALDERAIFAHRGERGVLVAGDDLRVHEPAGVVFAGARTGG